MKRLWAAIVVAMLVLAGAYAGSPYWAAKQFRAAAVSGDVDRLDDAVDFPAVRESVKRQVTAAAAQRMTNDPNMRGNPYTGLGMALMPMIVDRVIDAFVTPDGIAALVRQGKAARGEGDVGVNPNVRYDYGYRGLNRFVVTVRAPDTPPGQAPGFVFARRGLFSWKMVRLEIPDPA